MASYFESVFSGGGGRVFGYRLSTLSLRHMMALEAMESPVLTGEMVDEIDVIMACRILSARNDRELEKVLHAEPGWIGKKLFWLRCAFYSFSAGKQMAKWAAWQTDEGYFPKFKRKGKKGGGRSMKSCYLLVLAVRAVKTYGVSMAEAWWLRFSDVCHVTLAGVEVDGGEVSIYSDADVKKLLELGWKEEEL